MKDYAEIIRNDRLSELTKPDLLDERLYDCLIDEYCDRKGTAWVSVSNRLLQQAGEQGNDVRKAVGEFLVEAKKELPAAKQRKNMPMAVNQTTIQSIDADKNPLQLTEPELARAVCLNYTMDEDGIYEVVAGGGKKRFCHTPMAITMEYDSVEGNGVYYNVVYRKTTNGQTEICSKIYPAETLSSTNKILTLARDGILVNTNNARSVVDYLTECIAYGLKNGMPTGESTDRFGWMEDGKFSPYDDGVMFDGEDRHRQLLDSARSVKGDPDEYMAHMREVRKMGRLEINAAMAGAMASVMMGRYMESIPTIIHITGDTDSGKTMAIREALSQIGNPMDGFLLGDYRGTKAGIEARAGCLYNLPLALDDISKMSQEMRKGLESLVYDLCAGQGRTLGNKDGGNRAIKQWHCVVLSTGEDKISSYCNQGGGLNRVLEITAGDGLAFEHPEREIRFLKKNHGHVIRRFIDELRRLGEDAVEDAYERNKELIKQRLTDNVLAKQLQPLAVLLTADETLTDCIYKDGIYLRDRLDELIRMLKTEEQVSDGARAYETLKDVIAANPRKWYMDDPESEDAQGEQWGWKPTDECVCITGTALRQMLGKEGYNSRKFLDWAIKKGLTEADKRGNAPVQHLRTTATGADQKRAWRITITKDDGPAPDPTKAQKVDEELPTF